MIDRAALKQEAKTINRSAKVPACALAAIYLLILLVLRALNAYVSGDIVTYMQESIPEIPVPEFLLRADFSTTVILFVSIMVTLLCVVLRGGWCTYMLGVRQGREMGYGTLFDGFAFAGKLILLYIVSTIFIVLWLMLLVIPGIIAWYRYRFAVYNLCENPELGVMEALNMSKAQTAGYKSQLFMLDLSFLGWALLSALTLDILLIWLVPYYVQTDIGCFQQIKRAKGIGCQPTQEDGQFHTWDPFAPKE